MKLAGNQHGLPDLGRGRIGTYEQVLRRCSAGVSALRPTNSSSRTDEEFERRMPHRQPSPTGLGSAGQPVGTTSTRVIDG